MYTARVTWATSGVAAGVVAVLLGLSTVWAQQDTGADGCADTYGGASLDQIGVDPSIAAYYPADHCWRPGEPWNVYAPDWVPTPTPDGIHPQLVPGCSRCVGPIQYGKPTGDCVEWSNHRGDCATMTAQYVAIMTEQAQPQPTITFVQCVSAFRNGRSTLGCSPENLTQIASDDASFKATQQAAWSQPTPTPTPDESEQGSDAAT